MEELMSQIGNLGFPIVVSLYLLMRLEGKFDNLSVSINNLSKNIEAMLKNND